MFSQKKGFLKNKIDSHQFAGHLAHPFTQHQFYPLLQAPRFLHTLGVLGPKSHPPSQLFLHTPEVDLGVSFNAQSQVSDIPGISSHNALSLYLGSFNVQSKAPDIPAQSLRASIQELSRIPSTPKIKLPTIHVTSRTLSVIHVIGSQHHLHSVK